MTEDGPPYLVPPAIAVEVTEWQAEVVRAQNEILRAYGLEPWHVGLAPAPPVSRWRRTIVSPLLRAWLKITGRW